MTRYSFAWQSKLTGFRQHGEWRRHPVMFHVAGLRGLVYEMNARYPYLMHWASVENGWPE